MRIPLLVRPYRISRSPDRRFRYGNPFWRVATYGLTLFEKCECDSVQSCVVDREGDFPQEWDDEETGEHIVYDPRGDCPCVKRGPHTHSGVGMLVDRPISRKGRKT